MNKLVIIISLLILFLKNCFAKDELNFFIGENKIELEGYFIQGGYVKGKTSSKIKIKLKLLKLNLPEFFNTLSNPHILIN